MVMHACCLDLVCMAAVWCAYNAHQQARHMHTASHGGAGKVGDFNGVRRWRQDESGYLAAVLAAMYASS